MTVIVSLDIDDINMGVSKEHALGVPDMPKSPARQHVRSLSKASTTSIDSSSIIASGTFKRLITGESMTSFKRQTSGASTNSAPFQSQASGASSTNSAVPDILSPMSATRKDDLVMYPRAELDEKYTSHETLGQGGFGIVRKGISKETKKVVAIKSIKMDDLKFTSAYSRECIVAWMCDHPHLVRLIDCFCDDKVLHLVMDHLSGRTVNALVKSRQRFGEPRGLPADMQDRFVWAMLSGISYLHHHQIAHRDCKSENFMQKREAANAPLIMLDFGLAVRCGKDNFLTEKVGTPACAAPEVSRGSYNEKCDIWSIGVVSYMMCVGYLPFIGKDAKQVLRKVRDSEANFDAKNWDTVTPALKEMVEKMLVKDPHVRPSAKRLVDQNCIYFEKVKVSEEQAADGQPQQCCTIS